MRLSCTHLVLIVLITTGFSLGACSVSEEEPGVCGDGTVQGAEMCDGADLAGQTCQSLGYGFGTLTCHPDCYFDISGCSP